MCVCVCVHYKHYSPNSVIRCKKYIFSSFLTQYTLYVCVDTVTTLHMMLKYMYTHMITYKVTHITGKSTNGAPYTALSPQDVGK